MHLYSYQLIGGGGSGLRDLPVTMLASRSWQERVDIANRATDAGCGMTWLRAPAGVNIDGQRRIVGGWDDAKRDGLGWLADSFADAWGPLVDRGHQVISHRKPAMLVRDVLPEAGARAGMSYDTLPEVYALTEEWIAALNCQRAAGIPLILGEPITLWKNRGWIDALDGFEVTVHQREPLATGRLAECFKHPNEWMLPRDVDLYVSVVIDRKEDRLYCVDKLIDLCRCHIGLFTHDLTAAEIGPRAERLGGAQ